MGSLVAALASFLDAKTAGGSWSLRIDDIDPPREAPDAKIQILESLRTHGLHPDGVPIFQSKRNHRQPLYLCGYKSLQTPLSNSTTSLWDPNESRWARCSPTLSSNVVTDSTRIS
ncbi:MAG: hypothetical protein EBY62_00805 [Cellvibrionales bacterium]|nr:hypothetical protein [Cellvibrionales bacterium]